MGRTFIQPRQDERDIGVRIKFNPVREVLEGRRVVVVDDSIVRGTTSRKLVRLLRRAGAREVHFRVGSPPVTHPCFYGIDTPSRGELIGALKDVEEIRGYLGVDTLGYLSLEGPAGLRARRAAVLSRVFLGAVSRADRSDGIEAGARESPPRSEPREPLSARPARAWAAPARALPSTPRRAAP